MEEINLPLFILPRDTEQNNQGPHHMSDELKIKLTIELTMLARMISLDTKVHNCRDIEQAITGIMDDVTDTCVAV